MHPNSSSDTTAAWKKLQFILSVMSDFHMTDSPSIAVHPFVSLVSMSFFSKLLEKKLDGNYTRMLRVLLNNSWRQHPTRHQLYGHLPSISKTIQVRPTRHTGHCWRSRDEIISDVFLWTPTYGRVKAGRPARTYIQQLCENTGCSPGDLPEAIDDREKWRERVRDIRTCGMTWWCLQQVSRLFGTGIYNVVDSLKLSMLLLYIIWDDWPIFMISGSNEHLQ